MCLRQAAALRIPAAIAGLASTALGPVVCADQTPSNEFQEAAREMLVRELEAAGVRDPRVLAALRAVPRHEFVPPPERARAYENRPLPIGEGQTISQPFVVAAMSEALELSGDERVLEIGTGSGYQAAVLAELAEEVFSIEIVPSLAREAAERLSRLGYDRVHVRQGDGYAGWPEEAPFDAIVVTAAPDHVPKPLMDQLALGGRLVLPVGPLSAQELVLVTRDEDGTHQRRFMDVRFVPMTGRAQQ
ncbi:MAG: protein-L-isoaspartate(D-aspartate) O-methyltransferase [Myxococcota bacterium]